MRLPRSQQTAAALLLAVTTGLLAGCSTEDVAMARKACLQNQAACKQVLADLNASLNQTVTPLEVVRLAEYDVPKALADWAKGEASAQVAGRALQTDTYTYLAISGGMKSNGGWTVQVDRISQVDGGYRVEASILPPVGPAIDAVTQAVGFFRVKRIEGAVAFVINPGSAPATNPGGVHTLSLEAASANQAPAKLQEWVSSQRGMKSPEGKILTVGTETWIGLSGGVQPTGGYKVEIEKATQVNGTWIIEASVVPPPPGSMVIQVLTTPTAYFKTGAITGPVEIRWTQPQTYGVKQ